MLVSAPLRRLLHAPGFSLAVILTLALSVGANTAVFSLVNALLLRPLPYPQPERLAGIEMTSSVADPDPSTSIDGETWELIRDQVPQVTPALSSFGGVRSAANVRTASGVQSVSSMRVSAEFFGVLGELPALGRSFTAEEDRDGGPHAVIISDQLWRTALQSNPQILGQPILVKGEPYTVVGVLGPHFTLPRAADIYTPIRPSRTGEGGGTNYHFIARLKPGVSWQAANAALGGLQPRMLAYHGASPRKPGEQRALVFIPLEQHFSAEQRGPALGLLVATGLIVLIACANLASLTLVRLRRRSAEIATRLALGAGRAQLLRELWAESAILATAGGFAGLLSAIGLLRALVSLLPAELVPFGGVALDQRVLLFTLAISLGTSLLFGTLPGLAIFRMDPASVLGQRTIAGHRNSRARQLLIAGEVALTVLLLAGSGLLIRTLVHLETLPPGFDPHGVLTAKASLDQIEYRDPARFQTLMRESVAAMERIPAVKEAAVGLSLPYERALNNGSKVTDGKEAGQEFVTAEVYITPGYFSALGMRLRQGRPFSDSDTSITEPVAIVNETFARQVLHDPNPIGRHLGDKDSMRIIGVCDDVQAAPGLDDTGPLNFERTLYVPAAQFKGLALIHAWFQPSWIIRSDHLDAQTPAAMQRALNSVDPNLPFASFHTMDELLATALSQQRIEVALLGSLAGLALLLAMLGIFALVSSVITERQREFGIRLALGSPLSDSMLVAGRAGLLPAVLGLLAGLALSSLALRVMQSVLFGVAANDPLTLAGTTLLLMIIATLASLLPTLRIARIHPAEVLRTE
ncbi:MAG: efflux pump, inner rane subunit [Acidobacteriaceae bacterium]|nr:efflux pump, inner rane subunit [Acidobacteriaceae bacterium]